MKLPFSSVVSYHTNPTQCGVAKFSAELAKRLGVPFRGMWSLGIGSFPLYSLKWSELVANDNDPAPMIATGGTYGIFWHDAGDPRVLDNITSGASVVFYADPSLGSPGLWCPSLITPRKRLVRLFSFGMASKLQPEKYRRVRELLDAASIRYHLRVSVGLHEGTSLDGAEKHFDALKEIMGPENVTILGILSDDAVSEELANCDYVLAFFEKGLRANNTTVHAALDAMKPVITNWDDATPEMLKRVTGDIAIIKDWGEKPRFRFRDQYSWDHLIEVMRKECERSRLPAAG